MIKATNFAALLLAGLAAAAVPLLPGGDEVADARAQGLRLVKTSDEDPGTWMTEEEKFEKLISKRVGFADITDTLDLEAAHLARLNSSGSSPSSSLSKRAFPSGPTHQVEARPLVAAARQANLEAWARGLADFFNRYYRGANGAASSAHVYELVQEIVAGSEVEVEVRRFEHAGYDQPSVIAALPGTGAGDGVVVVSAHFDSIGSTTNGRAPGADDNASGVVVVLEALRVLAEAGYQPKNTLEFHFYSGEEGGLLGSRDVMQRYAADGVEVLAVVNQDMTGYSPNNVIAVYTDYVDPDLTRFVQTLVPAYTGLPLSTDICGYGCSDHASARSAGFPAAYVCDENYDDSSPYIHSERDTIETVSFEHVLEHAKFTIGFLVEASYF